MVKLTLIFLIIFSYSCSSIKLADSYASSNSSKAQIQDENQDFEKARTVDQLIDLIDSTKIEDLSLYDPLGEDNLEPYHIPDSIKVAVDKWLHYFQTNGRAWFQRTLTRSEQYEIPMKNILINYNIPEELFYVAFIESGFVLNAKSRASAKGPWQFMSATARMHGLEVSSNRDDRIDPFKSTAAAASHLRDLYNLSGSWYLALSSYNAGENRVRNAIIRNNERNFWKLAEKEALPNETMNYVPKYIATTIIAKAPEKFGFTYNGPAEYDEKTSSIVENLIANSNFDRRFVSNPRVYTSSGTRYYTVRSGDSLSVIARKNKVSLNHLKKCNPTARDGKIYPKQKLKLNCNTNTYAEQKVISSNKTNTPTNNNNYTVRRGDNLHSIAKRNNTTVDKIKICNNLNNNIIYPGQSLNLNCSSSRNNNSFITYTVRSGENLTSIAQKHNISVAEILEINNIKNANNISSGTRLKIKANNSQI